MGIFDSIVDAGSGLLGGAGDVVKDVFDTGKNTQRVNPFSQSADYNPNAFQYGGQAGYAQRQADMFQGLAGNAQNRAAAQADYGQANQYAGLGLGARGQQQQVANMMLARAQGQVPSIAGMQAAQDMQRAQAAQASMAASARGAAGMALAQQNAANNVANTQGMISGQAQINAANERLAAENAAMGGFAGLRAGDVAGQQAAAQQAQYNAGLQQQQRGLNDQYSQAMFGNAMNTQQQQLQAQMGQQNMLANNSLGAQSQQANIGQNNANTDFTQMKMIIGGGQGAADTKTASGTGSDDRMKSGLTPLGSGYGSSDELKMGLTPLGNVTPIGGADTSASPSWKQSAIATNAGALGMAGFSPAQAESIRNPGGVINGWTSDDRAKKLAFQAGAQHAVKAIYGDDAEMQAWPDPDAPRADSLPAPSSSDDTRQYVTSNHPTEALGFSAKRPGGPGGPDMTAQLAQGLAPYAYEYKPGMGPPGTQVGPRAQLMASQPTTATAITKRPDGLMQIDPAGGTKVALGGVGQLANEIQSLKSYLGLTGGGQ